MNKKISMTGVLLFLFLFIAVSGTFAYFSDRTETQAVVTSGTVDVELKDIFPENGIQGAVPGLSYNKEISAMNTSFLNDIWLRIQFVVEVKDAEGNMLPTVITGPNGEAADIVTINLKDGTKWVKDGDFYYYSEKLPPRENADVLCENVSVSPYLGSEYQGCTLKIIVNAEAVQADNTGETYSSVRTWSESN